MTKEGNYINNFNLQEIKAFELIKEFSSITEMCIKTFKDKNYLELLYIDVADEPVEELYKLLNVKPAMVLTNYDTDTSMLFKIDRVEMVDQFYDKIYLETQLYIQQAELCYLIELKDNLVNIVTKLICK